MVYADKERRSHPREKGWYLWQQKKERKEKEMTCVECGKYAPYNHWKLIGNSCKLLYLCKGCEELLTDCKPSKKELAIEFEESVKRRNK